MKKSLTILFCVLICWMSASGAFAKGYNQDTQKAQNKLSALGYAPGPADGRMGDQTCQAIKKFQKDKGLKATGTLDTNTLNMLLNRTSDADRPAGNSNTSGKNPTQKQAANNPGKQTPSASQGNQDGVNPNKPGPMEKQ